MILLNINVTYYEENKFSFTLSHVIRLGRHKTEKVKMAKYNLSVHVILNIFLERAFYICSLFV